MILLGFARFCLADGFFTQTQNAVNHYRNGYYSRNSGIPSRSSVNSFSKYLTSLTRSTLWKSLDPWIQNLTRILAAMIENIRTQEQRNSRIAYNHQNQRMEKDDDRPRRDAQIKQMYNRIAFLRRSCRCRFICTGLNTTDVLSPCPGNPD